MTECTDHQSQLVQINENKSKRGPAIALPHDDLVTHDGITPNELRRVAEQFEIRITKHSFNLMNPADPNDPISRQYLPSAKELMVSQRELSDPIGDIISEKVPGLQHRFEDRVLLRVSNVCATYCRFCVRRELVGGGKGFLSDAAFEEALAYIASHKEVWEVILSGGDPLLLPAERLSTILDRILALEHVGNARIHTKLPIVAPHRIGAELVQRLRKTKSVWVSIHCNHPKELTPDVKVALARFVDAGIPLISQSVLLRGVNDNAEILKELFRSLIANRVKPYYLYQADLAKGTKHFRTSIEQGQRLMRALTGSLSGICLPTYVLDIPGGHAKLPIGPQFITRGEGEPWQITDTCGIQRSYCEDAT